MNEQNDTKFDAFLSRVRQSTSYSVIESTETVGSKCWRCRDYLETRHYLILLDGVARGRFCTSCYYEVSGIVQVIIESRNIRDSLRQLIERLR